MITVILYWYSSTLLNLLGHSKGHHRSKNVYIVINFKPMQPCNGNNSAFFNTCTVHQLVVHIEKPYVTS